MLERLHEIIVSDHCSPVPFPTTDSLVVNGGSGAEVNSGAAIATGDLRLVLQRRLAYRGQPQVYLSDVRDIHAGGGSSDPAKRRRWQGSAPVRVAQDWGGSRHLGAALTGATALSFRSSCARRVGGVGVGPMSTAREELSLIWSRST